MIKSLICLVALQLTAVWGLSPPKGLPSMPGSRCPPIDPRAPVGTCQYECPCAAGLECCYNGCGRVCVRPVPPIAPPSLPSPRCPDIGGQAGICVEECSRENPCASGLLCCSNGCGHTCVRPVLPPLPPPVPPPIDNRNPCDSNPCPPDQDCVTLRATCKMPPCPIVHHQCVPKPPVPVDPCASNPCPADQDCIAEKVLCVRAPCDPIRRCVPKPAELSDPCESVTCETADEVCRVEVLPCLIPPCPVAAKCVPAVEGKCPRLPPLGLCRVGASDQCKYDRQCGPGLLCCIDNCGKNQCMNPEVLTNPCAATTCPTGQECQVKYTDCAAGPCPPPIGVCVGQDPCALIDCAPGFKCVNGECIPADIVDLCATIFCGPGTVCIDGRCIDPCDQIVCAKDEECVLRYPPCAPGSISCPPLPVCEKKVDPCATVRCRSGTVCVDGNCVDICELPKEPGNCRGAIPRYYYDSSSETCQQFIYGGCNGNENNFQTLKECNDKCSRHVDACKGVCGRQKCLSLRNGKNVCVPMYKYGTCPRRRNRPAAACDSVRCTQDYECSNDERCCTNQCGEKQCTKPISWRG